MTVRAFEQAEVLRRCIANLTELRALKAHKRGRLRLFLEVNATRLERLLAADDDRQLYRCTEFDTEAELMSAYERAAAALAH